MRISSDSNIRNRRFSSLLLRQNRSKPLRFFRRFDRFSSAFKRKKRRFSSVSKRKKRRFWIRCRRKLITALYGAVQNFVSFLRQRISLSRFSKFRLRWVTWVSTKPTKTDKNRRKPTPLTSKTDYFDKTDKKPTKTVKNRRFLQEKPMKPTKTDRNRRFVLRFRRYFSTRVTNSLNIVH